MQASFLFDNLSTTYNSVNRILSFGLDTVARKKAVVQMQVQTASPVILDLYSGSGNNIPLLLKIFPDAQIDAIDNSEGMIQRGRVVYMNTAVQFLHSDFIEFDFSDKKYDAIICSYGLKCIPADLYEEYLMKLEKLLQPTAQIIFLDIIHSKKKWLNNLFALYFKLVLRMHPKVNRTLRIQYLQLLDFMHRFDKNNFLVQIEKSKVFTLQQLSIGIPMLYVYKITKR